MCESVCAHTLGLLVSVVVGLGRGERRSEVAAAVFLVAPLGSRLWVPVVGGFDDGWLVHGGVRRRTAPASVGGWRRRF